MRSHTFRGVPQAQERTGGGFSQGAHPMLADSNLHLRDLVLALLCAPSDHNLCAYCYLARLDFRYAQGMGRAPGDDVALCTSGDARHRNQTESSSSMALISLNARALPVRRAAATPASRRWRASPSRPLLRSNCADIW